MVLSLSYYDKTTPIMKLKFHMIDESIFREYDIRGIVPSQVNEASIKLISHAIARKCIDENIDELVLGRDGRLSGEKILKLLSKELKSIGINIVNIGIVTSPSTILCGQATDFKIWNHDYRKPQPKKL